MTRNFAVGQSWRYGASFGFESSRIVIGAIVPQEDVGEVVCVMLVDVPLPPHAGGLPQPTTIDFVPFAREAIDASVTELAGDVSLPPLFAELLDSWQEETAGDDFLTISVPVFLDILAAAGDA